LRQAAIIVVDRSYCTKDDDYRLMRLLLMSRQNVALRYRICK